MTRLGFVWSSSELYPLERMALKELLGRQKVKQAKREQVALPQQSRHSPRPESSQTVPLKFNLVLEKVLGDPFMIRSPLFRTCVSSGIHVSNSPANQQFSVLFFLRDLAKKDSMAGLDRPAEPTALNVSRPGTHIYRKRKMNI